MRLRRYIETAVTNAASNDEFDDGLDFFWKVMDAVGALEKWMKRKIK